MNLPPSALALLALSTLAHAQITDPFDEDDRKEIDWQSALLGDASRAVLGDVNLDFRTDGLFVHDGEVVLVEGIRDLGIRLSGSDVQITRERRCGTQDESYGGDDASLP